MRQKTRKKFTQEQRDQAISAYISGEKKVSELAQELDVDPQTIYNWKVQKEEAAKGIRLEHLVGQGYSKEVAKILLAKDLEIEMYQKKLAEQIVITDLLKKLQNKWNSASESELSGLINITLRSGRNKRPVK